MIVFKMVFAFLIANIGLLLLDFNTTFLQPSLGRTACPPYISKDALPFCPFGTFPHTVGNHPRRAGPARPQLPAARILQPPFFRITKKAPFYKDAFR